MTGLEALIAAGSAAMSSIPAWVPTAASLAATAVGGAAAYGQSQQQAAMAKQTGEHNAKELERAAQEERAAGARKATERRLQTERVLSRQRAVAADSGAGGGETEGFSDVIGDTAGRGQYLSDLDIASGENAAVGLESKAAWARTKGDAEAEAARSKGTSALIGTAFNMAATGIKRAPLAPQGDDLIDYYDDKDSGWVTKTRRAGGGRYYS